MPYLINKTSGAKITTVQDGTIDTSSLDITLVGKNYTGYGEAFNENFVKMLEHFAGSTEPVKPIAGQLWYDSSNKVLKLFTGVGTKPWKSLGLLETDTKQPAANNAGELWFNSEEGRLYAYSARNARWNLIGPLSTRGGESGALEYTALKATTGDAIVVKLVVDGRQPAIFSSESFEVRDTDSIYSSDGGSYPFVKKGITLADIKDNATGVSFTPGSGGSILWGTAASALGLVGSDDVYYPASSFLLQAALASLPNNINITNDDGILISDPGVMKLHVTANMGNISILNKNNGDRLGLNINIGAANTSANVISITTASSTQPHFAILPNSTATIWVGTNSQRFSYGFFNTLTATTIVGSTVSDNGNRVVTSVTPTGGTGISIASLVSGGPGATFTINNAGVVTAIGTANQISVSTSTGDVTFSLPQNIHSGATPTFSGITVGTLTAAGGNATVSGAWKLGSGATFQATYADLAERYAADAEYEPGTVLVIGGSAEVTTTTRHGDTARAGIVSTDPAYTLNAEAGDDSTHPLIALAGRVPCKVKGFVRKGDLLVTSTEAGYAEAAHANDHPNAVLARSLEDFEGNTGIIQVMVV